jgi:NarL family two-component system response regulator LiaR
MKKIRVLVVDDHPVVRKGIGAILSSRPDIEVVGEAEDGIQALSLAKQMHPDVVLLDLIMPRQDGLTTIPMIKATVPEARILVLTNFAAHKDVIMAIKAGALGLLLKDTVGEKLVQSVYDVAEGKVSLHPSVALKLFQEINDPSEPSTLKKLFSQGEMKTLGLIGRGMANKQIAMELHVSNRTIAKRVSSILRKTHLANRVQVALFAVQEGFVGQQDNTTEFKEEKTVS